MLLRRAFVGQRLDGGQRPLVRGQLLARVVLQVGEEVRDGHPQQRVTGLPHLVPQRGQPHLGSGR